MMADWFALTGRPMICAADGRAKEVHGLPEGKSHTIAAASSDAFKVALQRWLRRNRSCSSALSSTATGITTSVAQGAQRVPARRQRSSGPWTKEKPQCAQTGAVDCNSTGGREAAELVVDSSCAFG